MQGITKTFGTNIALNKVDFYCNKGEVISLLGENGAGKSTLMKILYGMYFKDQGNILYEGNPLHFETPKDAIKLGIQMVHQHFMLVDKMTVIDNIMLGKEAGNSFYYDRKKARSIVKDLGEKYGLQVPYDKKIKDISVGERQKVEILKALYQEAELLILDEPTAVLTPQEVLELLKIIENLRDLGRTVIIITHKLKETMAVADRVYVLRNGEMVGQRNVNETNIDELSELMVGHKVIQTEKKSIYNEEVLVKVEDLKYKDSLGVDILKGVNFQINKQEIVGIAGVEGNGQTEIINCLNGIIEEWEGSINIYNVAIKGKTVNEILNMGVSCIHSDRQENSISEPLDVANNYLMGHLNDETLYKNNFIINWEEVNARSQQSLESNDVRPRNIKQKLGDFSGGNQQKFVVGRETEKKPSFIIAAHPTRGVDIMASAFIHDKLNELKEQGSAVLVVSSDLDELRYLSDRILVVYDGKIVADRETETFTNLEIGKLMGGGV